MATDRSSQMKAGPFRGPRFSRVRKCLGGGDVRGLKALVALHDFELDALPLGQRAVAVHLDRAVVDEHVIPTLALDEAESLLVREPLDGAFSQHFLLLQPDSKPA